MPSEVDETLTQQIPIASVCHTTNGKDDVWIFLKAKDGKGTKQPMESHFYLFPKADHPIGVSIRA